MKQHILVALLFLVSLVVGISHIVQVSRQAPRDGASLGLPVGNNEAPRVTPEKNSGPTAYLYEYECDEHVAFEVSFAPNMSALHIAPKDPKAAFPPKGVLSEQTATSGVLYTNKDLVFTGRGEGVTLGEGEKALQCSPVSKPNEVPMNFGD